MRFRVGLRTRLAGPGDVVEVAPGVMHSFANAGEEEARLRVEVRPALAMEQMFAEVVAMAQAGPHDPPRAAAQPARARARSRAATTARPTRRSSSVGLQRLLLAPLVFAGRHPRLGLAGATAATAGLGLVAG